MSDRPLFESLEGLRGTGTGKSTIAPMLAAVRGAVLVPTVSPAYQRRRRDVDARGNAEARMCLYLSALFTEPAHVGHQDHTHRMGLILAARTPGPSHRYGKKDS